MATKQELEIRVTELEAQLASEKVSADSRVAELELDLSKTLEREKSIAEHADSLSAMLRILQSTRPDPFPLTAGSSVVLNGMKYDIIHQCQLHEVIHLWRQQQVQDTELTLVVVKA